MKREYLDQKAVVSHLRSGEMLLCKVYDYFSESGKLQYSSTRYMIAGKRVHAATVSALIRKKIIHGPDYDPAKKYKLLIP